MWKLRDNNNQDNTDHWLKAPRTLIKKLLMYIDNIIFILKIKIIKYIN